MRDWFKPPSRAVDAARVKRADSSTTEAQFVADLGKSRAEADRMFRWLLLAQWAIAVALALTLTPSARVGDEALSTFVLGGSLCITPLVLAARKPGWWMTRQIIAATQMLFSALLIHVTGGRVEANFHVFGSLAFLAVYRDWRVLATATVFVAVDHLVRGVWWPQSPYGVVDPEWWRVLEHTGWVLFVDTLLLLGISRSLRALRRIADREAKLEASREQFRALVESTQAIAWEFVPEQRRSSYVAPQIQALLGYPLARYDEPEFYRSVVHEDDLERFERAMYRGIALGIDFQEELRLVASDGRIVHIRSVVAVARREKSTLLRGVMFDISHQKLLEAELREAQKLESIGRLAASVAHGINTPLQYIGNNVEFIALAASRLLSALEAVAALGDEDTRVADVVRRAKVGVLTTRLPAAISATHDGLHAVERIVGTLRLLNGPKSASAPAIVVDVVDALEAVIEPIRTDTPQIDIHLTVEDSVECVLGHPETLGQALTGLVRNAVEACTEGGRSDARVRVVALRRAHLVEIHIHDEGRGMSEAVRQRIFDPFFTTKGVGHGCGEGLHRIRDIIVGEHGGELSCERSSDAGTTFVVRLGAAIGAARVA